MIEHAYIHIPFCIRKCHYCSFVSGVNIKYKEEYLMALSKQIQTEYNKEKLKTLYIGGGTPSLLEAADIENLLKNFNFYEYPEITLEANPETVSYTKFKEYKSIGINRISLGVQTFNNTLLLTIGRNHSEKEIYSAIKNIKEAEFDNINIDLIYGLPSQNITMFNNDIEKAVELEIAHISSYGLKIEDNSYFYENLPTNLPDDEIQAQMYLNLCTSLKNHNFNHYEISNFAKKGYESKHNNAYWENKNYYGFGLNASGYIENLRYKNTSNLSKYISNPLEKEEKVYLTKKEELENEIFLALRLKKGIDINNINKKYSVNFKEKYNQIIKKYTDLNFMEIENGKCRLTSNGILLSNNIMSEFIEID